MTTQFWVNTWGLQQVFGLLLFVGFIVWHLREKFSVFILLPYAFFAAHGLLFGRSTPVFQLTTFLLFLAYFPHRWIKYIFIVLCLVFTVDASFIIYHNSRWGLMNANTFDSAIMSAVVLGCLVSRVKWCWWFLLPIAAAKIGGVTTYAVLGITLVFAIFPTLPAFLLSIFGLLLSLDAVYLSWPNYDMTNGRIYMWQRFYLHWEQEVNHWLGVGFGRSEEVLTKIDVMGEKYAFMHNDLLQLVFETGYIGAVFISMFIIYIFYTVRNNHWALCFMLCWFVMSLTYFPNHYFLSQFIFLLILEHSLVDSLLEKWVKKWRA